ncbi:hypothetical protein GCM10022221_36020 [Actinocorallia aurea]
MSGAAWPFAVTRSRRHGYRTVMAPPGIAASVLSEGTVDDIGPRPHVREVTDADGGRLWLVYRVSALSEDEVGAEGTPVLDRYGRPVRLTEGVVVHAEPAARLGGALFDELRKQTVPALSAFWQADDPNHPVQRSEALPAAVFPGELDPITDPPYVTRRSAAAPPSGPFPAGPRPPADPLTPAGRPARAALTTPAAVVAGLLLAVLLLTLLIL